MVALLTVRRARVRRLPRRSRSCASPSRRRSRSPTRRPRSSTSTSRPRRTRCAGTTLPGRDGLDRRRRAATPYQVTADAGRRRGSPTSTSAAGATSSTSARVDPETGKHSEETVRLFITVPFLRDRGADADRRPAGRGRDVRERRDPGRRARTTNADDGRGQRRRTSARPTPPVAAGGADARRRRPAPVTVAVAEDGTFSTPYELTAGRWSITVTASSPRGQDRRR